MYQYKLIGKDKLDNSRRLKECYTNDYKRVSCKKCLRIISYKVNSIIRRYLNRFHIDPKSIKQLFVV